MARNQPTKGFDLTTAAARGIIEAEKKKRDAKTARLREARLARENADLLAREPGEPRAKAIRARKAPK
jgi:hypothetical protein